MKSCSKCGVPLTHDNWFPSWRRLPYYFCRTCANERQRNWRKTHPKKVREYNRRQRIIVNNNPKLKERRKLYMRDYLRNNRLQLNGKFLIVRKRPFQGFCELCGKPVESNPRWHHWDDEHPEKGLWLDIFCHGAAEAHEQNGVEVPLYQELKERINKMS